MNEIFNFHGQEVRTVTVDNEPWFVANDVANVLGYANQRDALSKHVDDEDKITLTSQNATLENIPNRGLSAINESGLYSLILSSKLPQAKDFKRWVTSEVLPTIRKHGMYAVDDLLDNPDMAIAAFQRLKEERQLRLQAQEEVAQKNQIIQELQPKATYYDLILQTKDMLTTTQIAQDYGMSANKFNQILKQVGIQRKVNGQWILYTKYQGKGYIASRTFDYVGKDNKVHSKITTVWTQLGRRFLYEKLKDNDIYPLIEQVELF